MSYLCLHDFFWRQYNIWFIHNNNTFVNNTLNVVNATCFLELFPRSKWDGLVICDCTCDVPLSSIRKVLLHAIINQPSMSFFIFFKNGNSFSQDSKYLSFTTHIYFLLQCFLQWKKQTFVTELNIKNTYFYHNLQHKHRYFLIRFAQTKITLFKGKNWIIRENESFLIVEPCSRVMCCV